MNQISTASKGNRKYEVYQTANGFEAFCMIGENISRAFPVKTYKSEKAATKYGDKFLSK